MRKTTFFILLLLLPASLLGQGLISGLKINTVPSGARVTLDGDIEIKGLSPIRFPGELYGTFKLTVKEAGFETQRQILNLRPDSPMELTFNLTPKSKFNAAWRSMIFPGWGQFYSGRKGAGVIFTLLAAGVAGYYFYADNDFYEKLDDYVLTNSRFVSAVTDAEKNFFYPRLVAAKQSAYDAESRRFGAVAGVIAVWGFNLIDALVFFPKQKDNVAVNSLTIKPDPIEGGGQIVFSHRF